ncbi:MAG: hypothetical protein H6740_23305 [Alphaproteobacteria bacterium]|nr:hypothetical protein [Alphaproteobacteria bacterium]
MNHQELVEAFARTADDTRVSRNEREALRERLAEVSSAQRQALRAELFKLAAERLHDFRDKALLEWLDDALKLLELQAPAAEPARAFFGPGDPMVEQLESLVRRAQRRIDVAVFTITDNRLAQALLDAHRRGVQVRVLTDDEKAHDKGSDVFALAERGVPVRFDHSPFHFHHKFAVFDDDTLVTGSYNWTRGADRDNRENFTVLRDAQLVRQFSQAFEALWLELAD